MTASERWTQRTTWRGRCVLGPGCGSTGSTGSAGWAGSAGFPSAGWVFRVRWTSPRARAPRACSAADLEGLGGAEVLEVLGACLEGGFEVEAVGEVSGPRGRRCPGRRGVVVDPHVPAILGGVSSSGAGGVRPGDGFGDQPVLGGEGGLVPAGGELGIDPCGCLGGQLLVTSASRRPASRAGCLPGPGSSPSGSRWASSRPWPMRRLPESVETQSSGSELRDAELRDQRRTFSGDGDGAVTEGEQAEWTPSDSAGCRSDQATAAASRLASARIEAARCRRGRRRAPRRSSRRRPSHRRHHTVVLVAARRVLVIGEFKQRPPTVNRALTCRFAQILDNFENSSGLVTVASGLLARPGFRVAPFETGPARSAGRPSSGTRDFPRPRLKRPPGGPTPSRAGGQSRNTRPLGTAAALSRVRGMTRRCLVAGGLRPECGGARGPRGGSRPR